MGVNRVSWNGQLPHRVVMVRALRGLGDLLCVVPAWRALRGALPESEIILVGLPEVAGLVARFSHYVDELIPFTGYPGIVERPVDVQALPAFLAEMHARRFDLALQMHGSGLITNTFTALLGAQMVAGFYLPGHFCPDAERFLPYPDELPEVRRYLRLMAFLGIAPQGEALEFPISDAEYADCQALLGVHGLQAGEYVCLHPGAHDPARHWPLARFAVVGDALAARGVRVVVTGTASESDLGAELVQAMQCPALDLTGHTSLGVLAALLQGSRLLVCNDTGVSHLAAAMGTPSVVIFLASDPQRWAPLNRWRHRVVVSDRAAASRQPLQGIPSASVQAVWTEIEHLLSKEFAHVA